MITNLQNVISINDLDLSFLESIYLNFDNDLSQVMIKGFGYYTGLALHEDGLKGFFDMENYLNAAILLEKIASTLRSLSKDK